MTIGERPGPVPGRPTRCDEPVVRLAGLVKSYGQVRAVRGVDLAAFWDAMRGRAGDGRTSGDLDAVLALTFWSP